MLDDQLFARVIDCRSRGWGWEAGQSISNNIFASSMVFRFVVEDWQTFCPAHELAGLAKVSARVCKELLECRVVSPKHELSAQQEPFEVFAGPYHCKSLSLACRVIALTCH